MNARNIAYSLGPRQFASQAAVRMYVRQLVQRLGPGAAVEADDFAILSALFRHHPRSAEKIGEGVDRIEIRRATRNPRNLELWIRQTSGVWTDISWTECLRVTTPLVEFRNACRLAVKADTQRVRDEAFERAGGPAAQLRCPVTGELFRHGNSHVHHEPPNTFDRIVDAFVLDTGLDLQRVEYDGFDHGVTYVTLRDPELAERFRFYHNERAQLQVLSMEGHRRLCHEAAG